MKGNGSKIKRTPSNIIFNLIAYSIILVLTVFCIFPLVLIVSGSFTQNSVLIREGYRILPSVFSVASYQELFKYPAGILKAYGSTIAITVIGTSIGLFVMSMTGYVLQRKDFFYRNRISFIIYFTTIFGGGMVPWYILLSKYLHLQNSYVARVLPLLMTPFLIILMRTFISSSCPVEIVESAKIDGAGDFKIFNSIVLPIIGPGLATVGLFLALAYWNEWYLTSLFITNRDMYSLQFYLYDMLNSARFAQEMGMYVGDRELPSESIKMAMVVVTTGPIIFLYPFVQKYFVAGIAIGSVKG